MQYRVNQFKPKVFNPVEIEIVIGNYHDLTELIKGIGSTHFKSLKADLEQIEKEYSNGKGT